MYSAEAVLSLNNKEHESLLNAYMEPEKLHPFLIISREICAKVFTWKGELIKQFKRKKT
jgi:hypothetical protein